MNIETYKQYWHDVHETLYTYSYSQLANAPIDHETFVFLTSWGLPSATAPFVTFTEITQPYFVTINDFFDISFPKLQNYWVFGTNGSGDPICIDTQKKYEIVYLNHDNHYQRIFINNSITQFAFCLIKYRNFIAAIIDNT
ncbi:MAG TPA: SUKH-4 family immunity protein, partial [Chitinophagales bacterium]|nr:SUKH-4 family immunity protein [Chitinophagales bacterium]